MRSRSGVLSFIFLAAACGAAGDEADSDEGALAAVRIPAAAQQPDGRSWVIAPPGQVSYRLTLLDDATFRLHAMMNDPATKKVAERMVVEAEDTAPAPPVRQDVTGDGLRFSWGRAVLDVTMPVAGTLAVNLAIDGNKAIEDFRITPATHAATVSLRGDEHVYGFGDKRAAIDQRGHVVPMVNKDAIDPVAPAQPGPATETNDSYKSVPFYFTTKGYGLFAHDFYPGQFDVGAATPDRIAWRADGGDLDFYVFAQPKAVDILGRYTALTGRPALMPKWFFGYHQSRAGYEGLQGRDVAKTMRDKKLPLDVIYYDDFVEEAATKAFIDEMKNTLHVRMTYGANPFIIAEDDFARKLGRVNEILAKTDGSPVIEPAAEMDDDSINVAYIDFFNPHAAADFFAHTWTPTLNNGGLLGMADFGELDHLTDPDKKLWPSLGLPATVTRNVYSLAYAEGLVGTWQKQSGARSAGMIRAGTAGTQRYGWSTTGDSEPTYDNWKAHLRCLFNLALSGFSNIGYDIGGWDGKAPDDVYVRWFAAGTFNPFMWAHGEDEHEPYAHGADVESAARTLLGVRYRLIPYLYSLNDLAHRTGVPILRPFPLVVPDDPKAPTMADEFFVGDALLVAPVTNSAGRDVYLPAGSWYDFFDDGPPIPGGATVSRAQVPFDRIPAFVRAGSILPLGSTSVDPPQYVDERPNDPLAIHLYAFPDSGSASFDVYDDDGLTMKYETGALARTHLSFTQSESTINLSIQFVAGGGFTPPDRPCEVIVHGFGAARPPITLPSCKTQDLTISR
jgi:alpha-glucosidase